MNGTVIPYQRESPGLVTGKIAIIKAPLLPYDSHLREICKYKPLAVLILRYNKGVPGNSMYFTDGLDRRNIDCVVIETFIDDSEDASKIPRGTFLEIEVEENAWKAVKETKFQAFASSFLSIWEICIVIVGLHRLQEFWISGASMFSIGPLCLLFEIGAVLIRLAYTLVDPFWTYRMLHTTASNILFTAHYPFGLCSGILLTFYCT